MSSENSEKPGQMGDDFASVSGDKSQQEARPPRYGKARLPWNKDGTSDPVRAQQSQGQERRYGKARLSWNGGGLLSEPCDPQVGFTSVPEPGCDY